MTVRVVNSFLSPAYWGSFFALCANLILTLLFTYGGISTDFDKELSGLNTLKDYVYIAAILIVFIFVIRFYLAVAMQTYIGDEGALYKAPPQMKVLLFLVFVVLIFLSGINTLFVSYPFVILALWVCIIQSFLSFICVSTIEIWRWFRPSQIPKTDRNYFASEIMFGGMVLFVIWVVGNAADLQDNLTFYKIPLGAIIALMIFVALHEWIRLYGKRLRDQLSTLLDALGKG